MSERMKEKLGDELYNQILEKGIKQSEFDLVDGWIPRNRLNAETDKVKNLSDQIKTLENQLNGAKGLINENEGLKNKYAELETRYNNDLTTSKNELVNIQKKYKLENNLVSNGANQKYIKLLMKDIDFQNVEIDKSGEIINTQNIIDNLKKEYTDLFTVKTNNSGEFKKPDNTNNSNGIDWESKFKTFKGGNF